MAGCVRACGNCLCGCAIGILKIIIFFFNVLFWLTGLALIGISIYLLVEGPAKEYEVIVEGVPDDMWVTAVATMLTVGILMFLAGMLGCCGGMKANPTMLCWYSILMTIVLLAQCTVGIYISIQVGEIEDHLEHNLERQVKEEYKGTEDDEMTKAWDSLQEKLDCCGANNYLDYKGSYYENTTNNPVPESCCEGGDSNYDECKNEAASGLFDTDYLYTDGCHDELSTWIDDYATTIYIVVYIIAAVEIICILIGCCACCSIKKQRKTVTHTQQQSPTVVVIYK